LAFGSASPLDVPQAGLKEHENRRLIGGSIPSARTAIRTARGRHAPRGDTVRGALMNTLLKTFFKGLLAFLPIFLTIYAVYAFANWLNRISNAWLQWLAPGLPDVAGLGIAIGVLAIFALGVLVSSRLTSWIYNLVESPLRRVPVVREVYTALKQLIELIAPADEQAAGQVVSVRHPAHPIALVGVMMRSSVADLDDAIASDDMVVVYLPLSYQIGGYSVFVPREWVTPVDMPVEAAMRNALTGWMKNDQVGAPAARESSG
jgi:uncharacterized membrane protein